MEAVKSTKDFKIFKKRNGRYGVKDAKGTWINGDKKVEVLSAEGLIKVSFPKKTEEPPAPGSTDAQTDAPTEGETEEKPAE